MPAAVGTHWSKDFAEHLRYVHFTLMVASVGLILLVLSSKPYNPANALREIEEIIELKKNWSPSWLVDNCKCEPHWISMRDYLGVSPFMLNVSKSATPLEVAGDLHWKKSGIHPDQTPVRAVFVFPENNWTQDWHEEPEWSPQLSFPNTLAGFRKWWDALRKVHNVEVVLSVDTAGWLSFSAEELPNPNPAEDPGYVQLELAGDTSNKSLQRVGLYLYKSGDHFVYRGVVQRVGRVFFPVSASYHVELDQGALHTSSFSDWHSGPFERSFSDLAQAASGLEALELQDVQKFVSDDVAKGTQVFKAFGLELPAEQVTYGGIVILLATQVYFLAYLRQLSGKLRIDDPGWDVPWIAMNQSILARLISFVTLVLLPCAAVFSLGARAMLRLSADHGDRLLTARALGFIAAFALALVLGALSWKYRPQPGKRVLG
jgi:hypothetical protein